MTQLLNRSELETNRRTSGRETVINLVRKDFGRELARMTDPAAVLSLARKDLFEQVEYIVSEMLKSRRDGFSNKERTSLTGFVVEDLIRSSMRAVN